MENKDGICIDLDKNKKFREIICDISKELHKRFYNRAIDSISVPKSWRLMLMEEEWCTRFGISPTIIYGIEIKKHYFDFVYVDFKDGSSCTITITKRIEI